MSWRSRLLRLYPATWRARYGEEFDALLEDLKMSPGTLADVLVAALRTRLTEAGPTRPRVATGVLKTMNGGADMLLRLWTLVRVVVFIACVYVFFVVAVFTSSPSGTSIEASGVVIDLIALVVAIFAAWSLWHDRRALV